MRKILPIAAAVLLFASTEAFAGKCGNATAYQENVDGIPQHLLSAIARVESGRWNAETRQVEAWPWTVTSPEGDIKYPTKWAAIQAVRDLQRRGVRNIDVGCMQINLHHHPRGFRNLNVAFNPARNVAYAARFLKKLYRETGDWRMAVAYYHSRTPKHFLRYQAKVEELWQEARETIGFAAAFSAPTQTTEPAHTFRRPWHQRRHWHGWRQRHSFVTRPVAGGTWVPVTGGRFN